MQDLKLWEKLEKALLSLESEKRAEGNEYYNEIKSFLKSLLEKDLKIEIEIKPTEPSCDLLIKKGKDILCLIEFKKLCSVEFNANVINKGSKKCLILCSNGKLPNWGKNTYPNESQDGIGQIRGYFYRFLLYKNISTNAQKPFAILTNGFTWIIFDYRFLSTCPEEITGIVSNSLSEEEVIYFLLPEELANFKDFLNKKLSGLLDKEKDKYMTNKTVKILGNP